MGAELLRRDDGSERGTRFVRLRTGEIEFEVIVERALDIGQAYVRGIPVAWMSPTGIVAPWFADPHGWNPFRTFFGGLMTTCGLEHTLGPAEDDVSYFNYPGRKTEHFPLHGRLSTTPARLTAYGLDLDASSPVVYVAGDVRQANVFGEVLTLERRIEAEVGAREIRVRDRVRNDGFAPTPHMILYHVNVGWPILAPGAIVAAAVGEPRRATVEAEGVDWRRVTAPSRGVAEQVWEHSPRTAADGLGRAAVLNADIGDGRAAGLEVAFDLAATPRLFQWRVMNEGHYVVGLEPGNLELDGRQAAREAGRLVVLEPGESREYDLRLRLLHGAEDLDAARGRIEWREDAMERSED